MATAREMSPYKSFVEYLLEKMTPEEILAYKASDAEQERAEELTEKNKEGSLTLEERNQLQEMMNLEALINLLKVRAMVELKKHGSRS
ncbi:MAG: hypothetical protein ABI690_00695 [Chloroflexota bacterium]